MAIQGTQLIDPRYMNPGWRDSGTGKSALDFRLAQYPTHEDPQTGVLMQDRQEQTGDGFRTITEPLGVKLADGTTGVIKGGQVVSTGQRWNQDDPNGGLARLGDYLPYILAAVGGGAALAGGLGAGVVGSEAAGAGTGALSSLGEAGWTAADLGASGTSALSGLSGTSAAGAIPYGTEAGWTSADLGTSGTTALNGLGSTSSLSSILKNVLPSGASDWIKALLPSAIGAYASNEQTNALTDLANRSWGAGEPSRARYEGSYAPGFTMANDPGYTDSLNQTSKGVMSGLSIGGNPYGMPSQIQAGQDAIFKQYAYPALQDYRKTNANTGGLANIASGAPALTSNAIGSEANMWNALGSGLNNLLNPQEKRPTGYDPKTGKFTYNI